MLSVTGRLHWTCMFEGGDLLDGLRTFFLLDICNWWESLFGLISSGQWHAVRAKLLFSGASVSWAQYSRLLLQLHHEIMLLQRIFYRVTPSARYFHLVLRYTYLNLLRPRSQFEYYECYYFSSGACHVKFSCIILSSLLLDFYSNLSCNVLLSASNLIASLCYGPLSGRMLPRAEHAYSETAIKGR